MTCLCVLKRLLRDQRSVLDKIYKPANDCSFCSSPWIPHSILNVHSTVCFHYDSYFEISWQAKFWLMGLSVCQALYNCFPCAEKKALIVSLRLQKTASCRRRHAFQFVRTVSSGVAFLVQPLQPPTWWTGSQIPRFKLPTGPGLCVLQLSLRQVE